MNSPSYSVAEFYPLDEQAKEIISALLLEHDVEGVEESTLSLKIYFKQQNFDPAAFLESLNENVRYGNIQLSTSVIENKNWNALWEAGFPPIVIAEKVRVRASFHQPDENHLFEIQIDPKMAFGTGHHESTQLMVEMMLKMDFAEKDVLDFGSGTGILSILAKKLNAKKVTAIDIEEAATDNMRENVATNDAGDIEIITGTADNIPQSHFNIILANVNKNIILKSLETLASRLVQGGIILFCGLLESDEDAIVKAAADFHLTLNDKKTKNEWLCLKLYKQ